MDKRTVARRRGWRDPEKYLKPALVLAFLAAALFSGSAWAQHHGMHHGFHHGPHGHGHGRAHVGVFIGAPLFYGPGWYGDPFYDPFYRPYYDRPYAVQPPPVYVERDVAPPASLWYFCNNPQGYYPYVSQCPAGWRAVRPDSVPHP